MKHCPSVVDVFSKLSEIDPRVLASALPSMGQKLCPWEEETRTGVSSPWLSTLTTKLNSGRGVPLPLLFPLTPG